MEDHKRPLADKDEAFEQERAQWAKQRKAFLATIENEKAKAANAITAERIRWMQEYAEKRSQDAFELGKQVGEDRKEAQELARLMVREDMNKLRDQITKLRRHLMNKYGDEYQGVD